MISRILRKIKHKIEYFKEEKEILESKSIDIFTLETICFLSGPYRNLTTLTASMAVLHPNCQVLNHAQGRILPHNKVDFFRKYSAEKFRNFVKYAIHLSLSGSRGRLGGNILLIFWDESFCLISLFKNPLNSISPPVVLANIYLGVNNSMIFGSTL